MISEDNKKLLDNFAVAIFYKDSSNLNTFSLVTACNYICQKKYNYFDLLNNKPLKNLPSKIDKIYAIGVPLNLSFYKLYNSSDDEKKEFQQGYFKNIEKSVFSTLQFENEEIKTKLFEWKSSSIEELIFFAFENYNLNLSGNLTKSKIINLLKKEHFRRLRDEIPYNIRRLLEIFNLKNEDEIYNSDLNKIKFAKRKWASILNNRKKFTYSLLSKEKKDTETINEIRLIKKEINENIKLFKNTIFSNLYEISTFWPIILYPRPFFSFENTSLTPLSSNEIKECKI